MFRIEGWQANKLIRQPVICRPPAYVSIYLPRTKDVPRVNLRSAADVVLCSTARVFIAARVGECSTIFPAKVIPY